MKHIFTTVLVMTAWLVNGQDFRPVAGGDLPGLTVLRSDTFSLQTVAQFDPQRQTLYAEYGFRAGYVIDYQLNGEITRLQVAVLKDGPSAFGLYSLEADTCRQRGLFTAFTCLNNDRFVAATGPLFIRSFSYGGTPNSEGLPQQIAAMVIAGNPQDQWFFPAVFRLPQLQPYSRPVRFMRGPAGLAKGAPGLADLLDGMDFECYAMEIVAPQYSGNLARLSFPEFSLVDDFLARAGLSLSPTNDPVLTVDGTYRSWYKINESKIIFLECSSPELKLYELIPASPDVNTWSIDH